MDKQISVQLSIAEPSLYGTLIHNLGYAVGKSVTTDIFVAGDYKTCFERLQHELALLVIGRHMYSDYGMVLDEAFERERRALYKELTGHDLP